MTSGIAYLILAAAAQAPAPGIAVAHTTNPTVGAPMVLPPQSVPPAAMQPPHVVAGPQPTRPTGHYFSVLDYPADAHGAEGRVDFQLTIDPTGRVIGCNITHSSGSRALDMATCRILQRRARYTPARDSNGNPTVGTIDDQVVWKGPPAH